MYDEESLLLTRGLIYIHCVKGWDWSSCFGPLGLDRTDMWVTSEPIYPLASKVTVNPMTVEESICICLVGVAFDGSQPLVFSPMKLEFRVLRELLKAGGTLKADTTHIISSSFKMDDLVSDMNNSQLRHDFSKDPNKTIR